MHPAGFEPSFSAGELPQTYALDRAATGMNGQKFGSPYSNVPSQRLVLRVKAG